MAAIDCPTCNGRGIYPDHAEECKNSGRNQCRKYGCPVKTECKECLGTGIWGYD